MIPSLTLLALSIAQSAPAQDEATPAVATETAWRTFDGVALIVNDDIVTLRQLDDSLSKARGNAEATLAQDANALRDQVSTGQQLDDAQRELRLAELDDQEGHEIFLRSYGARLGHMIDR